VNYVWFDLFERALPDVVADVRRSYPGLAVVEVLDHLRQTHSVSTAERLLAEVEELGGHAGERELLRAYRDVVRVLAWQPTHAELVDVVRRLAAPEFQRLTSLQEWWVHRAVRGDL
jgi:CTP:molybdopterin cytidylyltransferase MocA